MKKLLFLLLLLAGMACKRNISGEPSATQSPATTLRAVGDQLVDKDGNPLLLKGVAFGNEVWSNNPVPTTHHNEADFQRVKDMNMNAIRFYLNYVTFEDDAAPYRYKDAGWGWIDQNIAWAKKHGIYLILNMHVPQGGFQSLGEGGKLWNEVENQNRLVALWKEIARRYANEPMIAGYDLVNEPQPTQSLEQWRGLAQRITDAIREVDKNHVVIVEKALSVNRNFNLDENLNFPDIRDDNLMYTFHIYDPIEYTHQNAAWTGFGDGGKYPDENIITPLGTVSWLAAVTGNPRAPGGSSGWNYYEGTKHRISDPKISMAKVVLAGNAVGGRVYFDDFVVKEYDPNGNFVRDVMSVKPTADKEVYFWSSNNAGKGGLTDGTGRNGGAGYYVEGTTSYANLNLDWTRFVPQQGFSYQVSGWMRGENVAGNGEANIRLDFENVDGTVARRNKAYLETSLKRFVDFAKKRNRPMYLGEYGVIAGCFEPGKGGLQWVSDMVDISLANGLHSTYHAYHEDSFGIYPGYGTPVDPAKGRRELIDLFTQKFR